MKSLITRPRNAYPLYSYCDNNPVTRIDKDGYLWNNPYFIASVGGTINLGISLLSSFATGETISLKNLSASFLVVFLTTLETAKMAYNVYGIIFAGLYETYSSYSDGHSLLSSIGYGLLATFTSIGVLDYFEYIFKFKLDIAAKYAGTIFDAGVNLCSTAVTKSIKNTNINKKDSINKIFPDAYDRPYGAGHNSYTRSAYYASARYVI